LIALSSIIVLVMKLPARLTAALTLCLVIMSLLPLPVQAQGGCRYPVLNLSVNEVLPGDSVTVSGHDFDPDEYIDVYYYLDSTSRISIQEDILPGKSGDFTFSFTIPEVPAGRYRILAKGANDLEEVTLTVRPGLRISPSGGPIGTEVRVSGRGFAADETGIGVRYYLDRFLGSYEQVSENIEADSNGSWETTFEVPVSARGEHHIGALGSVNALIQGVRPAVFRIGPGISLAETSGAVGQTIAISATGFGANERSIRIMLDGKAVTTVPASITADGTGRWNASFTVPEMPAGEYGLTAGGDHTGQSDVGEITFEIRPMLVISPDEGHVGIDVTATGLGFPAGKRIVILYGDEKVADDIVDSEGSFEAMFEVPESRFGPQEVVAAIKEDPNSVSNLEPVATAIFIMESNHPAAPLPESPGDGRSIGFFRRATPTFEWEEVFDLSGVSYSIRVATSPDFEPESILISETELTVTSYTPEEPFTNGTYYWAVQAVDGAQNESDWTDARRFRVGRLPMWGFIAIFSFIGLLLGLRAYFILVRPKLYE
jgi:hypothetical protein